MTEAQADLLAEARDSIDAAALLITGDFPGYAAARAYYAMFYCAEALLEGEGVSFSKHSAVIAAFGQRYAKTGLVPAELHRHLIEAQALRQAGDYGERDVVTSDQAQEQIDRARGFLQTVTRVIERVDGGPTP